MEINGFLGRVIEPDDDDYEDVRKVPIQQGAAADGSQAPVVNSRVRAS